MVKFSLKIICVTLYSISLLFVACDSGKGKNENSVDNIVNKSEFEFEERLYKKALLDGDKHTAINSVNRMLLMDSTLLHFHDTLALLYFASNNMIGSINHAKIALKNAPDNLKMLELLAFMEQNSGDFDGAIEKFTRLFQVTQEYKYKYQLASVYYYKGDDKSANKIADDILAENLPDNIVVDLSTPDGRNQDVSINAASYFVKANLTENKNLMKSYLNKALKIQPNFQTAAYMLEELEVQIKMENIKQMEQKLRK